MLLDIEKIRSPDLEAAGDYMVADRPLPVPDRRVACTPNSLSQDVGLGLGAQPGEERLREVARDAGFSNLRRAAQTPVNLILELTP